MYNLTLEIIHLVLISIKLKKQLIEKYSGFDDPVSQIIAADARAAIRQNQEEMIVFSTLLQRQSINSYC